MAKSVKLADIAKEMGVSVVTVSKALSGQKGVSEQMREKIIKLADKLGYVQPSVAKKRAQITSYNIGVLIREGYLGGYSSFYWQMYQQVARSCVDRGSFSMLEVVTSVMEKDSILPMIVSESKIDGLIVIGALSDAYITFLQRQLNIPLVFMDFMDKKQATDVVISDSYYGGYYMTDYLIRMGHKNIAYVGTVGNTGSITDRYLGYMKALLEHGIPLKKEWIIDDRDDSGEYIDEENKMILPKEMPTAFFCNCDLTAGMLIKKLHKAGYAVPEDISVVGYDDFIYPGLCDIGITTYAVDIDEMSSVCVDNLIKKMSGQKGGAAVSVIEGKMVIRESVRKIK
ncbi:MAG: LacI family DNA-binding transcriptional regulator [Lachnospiraceae bacterium]|nr:LacI family DNA-binding transcriptional regulator [Lachnospiraceae bacterium]